MKFTPYHPPTQQRTQSTHIPFSLQPTTNNALNPPTSLFPYPTRLLQERCHPELVHLKETATIKVAKDVCKSKIVKKKVSTPVTINNKVCNYGSESYKGADSSYNKKGEHTPSCKIEKTTQVREPGLSRLLCPCSCRR